MSKRRNYGYRRKSSTKDNVETISWILILMIIVPIICFKILIKLFIWGSELLVSFFKTVSSLFNVRESKQKEYNKTYSTERVTTKPKALTKSNMNLIKDIKYETDIIKIPKLKIETPYDALFAPQIIQRGINYFEDSKVKKYKLSEQTCSCEINGNDKYKISITFYKNNKIKKAECTCPYFEKENVYCKHIYALLLNYCEKEHIDGFISEKFYEEKNKSVPNYKTDDAYNKMIAICEAMKEIIDNTQEYYNNLEDTTEIEDIYSEIMEYEEKLNKYHNSKIIEVNQLLINSAQNDLNDMRSLYDELEIEIDEIEDTAEDEDNDDYEFDEALAAGFVAHEMHKDYLRRKEEEEYEAEREELRSTWGLLDHEIDEVQKGDYEPWNFEEDGDLEEDDYYYEDDNK